MEDIEIAAPDGFQLVWRAHPVTSITDTRWVWASYDTVADVTIAWRCPDPGRAEGWREVDLDPVTWIPDPAPDRETRRQKCLLFATRGGRVIGIAIQKLQRAG